MRVRGGGHHRRSLPGDREQPAVQQGLMVVGGGGGGSRGGGLKATRRNAGDHRPAERPPANKERFFADNIIIHQASAHHIHAAACQPRRTTLPQTSRIISSGHSLARPPTLAVAFHYMSVVV